MKDKSRRILRALFERYQDNPLLLPADSRLRGAEDPDERIIADYIAGMTDRYAIEEYRRLFDPAVRA
jgi:dGTPase